MTIKVGIIIFDGVEELDFVGPWEVLQAAGQLKNNSFSCKLLSLDGEPVVASKGMKVFADGIFSSDGHDIMILPGGRGTRALLENSAFIATISDASHKVQWMTSVCTGSLVFAAAGLLNGRQCTSHHSVFDKLESMISDGSVIRNQRFVVDGHIVTSAGVSAGIDMAFWLVKELYSMEFAKEVQEYTEYLPLSIDSL